MIRLITFIGLLLFISCTGIISGDQLSESEIEYIKSLGLLDENENIIQFSSQGSSNKQSGNFYTNRRVASYWLGDTKEENIIHSAFYESIDSIHSEDLSTALTYSSHIHVFVNDSSSFKVYVDDDKENTQAFFDGVQERWESAK